MRVIFLTFSVIFIIAMLIGCIYMILYRISLNKALKENNGRHVKLPDVRSVIIFILVCMLFYGVYSTKSLITEMYENMDVLYEDVNRDLKNIVHDMESMKNDIREIRDASKLVANWDYRIVNSDDANKVFTYEFEVVLKTYSEDTKVSLGLNDMSIELTKNAAGKFIGVSEIGMFDSAEGELFAFINEDGKITSEKLEYVYISGGWKDYLPYMVSKVPENATYNSKSKKIELDQTLNIGLESGVDCQFTEVYMMIDVNGEETKKIDIGFEKGKSEYYISLEDELPKVEKTDSMYIYMVGIDSLGYTHKLLVNSWEDTKWSFYYDYEYIYDKDGNQLVNDMRGMKGSVDTCE